MNDKTDKILSRTKNVLISLLCIITIAFASINFVKHRTDQTELKDSRQIIAVMEAENRGLTHRLGQIQTEVNRVAIGVGAAADTAGNVAEGIGDVIAGFDDIDRILGELLDFFGRVEAIVGIGSTPDP